jgi:NosR/NirI family nitrous oxide reductase transcriptional regulator
MTRLFFRCLFLALVLIASAPLATPLAARGFGAYLIDVKPEEVFPNADHFGPKEGNPPAMAAFKGDQELGYVFEASDIGYSGKPIRILVGMDKDGLIVGAKVFEHHEPILLVGIPPEKLTDFVSGYVGSNIIEKVKRKDQNVDAISGATVTAIVINDGISRTAMQVAKAHGLAGFTAAGTGGTEKRELAAIPFKEMDWQTLLGDGSIRRMHLLNSDVDDAFKKIGVGSPEPYGKAGIPTDEFIDLYVALVSVEEIGRNVLGADEYKRLGAWLAPGQQAILVAARGDYSFRGSGFVRGGIFDRFQLEQNQTSILFKDHDYRQLGRIPGDLPEFKEIALFRIPQNVSFDPTSEWQFKLLAQRPTGPTDKAFTSFPLSYRLPDRFVTVTAAPAPTLVAAPAAAVGEVAAEEPKNELWKQIWHSRIIDIVILSLSLALLTLIFFFQDVLVKKAKLFTALRVGYLLFSVIWIGGWAQAQLSVVNVLTFTGALFGGEFRWEQFLLEPLIFILWCATAVSLLFWGRGPFCGWLCPFGSLQELLNHLARRVGIRQITIPFHWHERLWPIKYVIFLGLFGLSLNEIAFAEQFAEVEPFKTAILLRFMREWPFVLWAVSLLVAGLFIERFFCRYLCPLGAALAIPGRMRLFEWLKRRKQCGTECQLCAKRCTVQAIHPMGQINPNECIYCMQCQVIYWDDTTCPPLLLKKTGRGKKPAAKPVPNAAEAVAKRNGVSPTTV